jgi:hypothetical protein
MNYNQRVKTKGKLNLQVINQIRPGSVRQRNGVLVEDDSVPEDCIRNTCNGRNDLEVTVCLEYRVACD